MSHELLTIAHVHAYRDEMLSDSGTGDRGERPEDDQRPSRPRVLAGVLSIRLGSWLLRGHVEGLTPGTLVSPDRIRVAEREPTSMTWSRSVDNLSS